MTKINTIHIKWQQLFGKIEGLETDMQNRVSIDREIIPIIFIPGIMGSRLRRRKDKQKIWDPDAPIFMIGRYGWISVTAAERKALVIGSEFNPQYAEVDDHDAQHNHKFRNKRDTTREKRGWGGVMWGSYGDFLAKLQQHQWPSPLNACFEFPVHAFGYNWTASNFASGEELKRYIYTITEDYRNGAFTPGGTKRECNKVILVTHSMGGLVARSACVLHGAQDKVIGVIHGVQPAVGSPTAYWRMKAGFERPRGGPKKEWWDWLRNPLKMSKYQLVGHISAVILGTDGEEVTSLLANSPGGLELLPSKDYRDNSGNRNWLRYPAANGEVRLPVTDPYEEIYLLKDVAYRMVDPNWLDPGKDDDTTEEEKTSWELYCDYLKQAKVFHESLHSNFDTSFHPESYQFYGSDLDSADKVDFNREEYSHTTTHGNSPIRLPFTNKGNFKVYADKHELALNNPEKAVAILILNPPVGNGDGTVPEFSAKILPLGEKRTVKIGVTEGSWFEIGHQDIFGTSVAKNVVFNSIWNLAQKYITEQLNR